MIGPVRGTHGGDRWRRPLAALLLVTGTAHFVRPGPFEGIVPPLLGPALPWVWGSGVAELACAAALLAPGERVRYAAGLGTAALFAAVFPANVYMCWHAFAAEDASAAYQLATLARLPLQVPLVLAALRVARAHVPQRA